MTLLPSPHSEIIAERDAQGCNPWRMSVFMRLYSPNIPQICPASPGNTPETQTPPAAVFAYRKAHGLPRAFTSTQAILPPGSSNRRPASRRIRRHELGPMPPAALTAVPVLFYVFFLHNRSFATILSQQVVAAKNPDFMRFSGPAATTPTIFPYIFFYARVLRVQLLYPVL